MSSSSWTIERVVTLLTPVFGAMASWLTALIATNVPGAPALDAANVEGVEIAAFVGAVAIVAKWLHGRQKIALIQPPHEVPRLQGAVIAPPVSTQSAPTASVPTTT